ncbi:unnamed protein product [Zymoseptoria tritici ST99CH_3D1]|nr:unnamed protein product [Zymoseptoria tritici ST99CH_3D1]
MASMHHPCSLLDLPPEVFEHIAILTIPPHDDIANPLPLARAALQTLTILQLISKSLPLSTPYLRQLRLKLLYVLSPHYPSLHHLSATLPRPLVHPYLTIFPILAFDLFRSEFLPSTHPSCRICLLHLPALHEIHLSLGTLHFPSRARIYWHTSPKTRRTLQTFIQTAVLRVLNNVLALQAHKTRLTIRFNFQYDTALTGMESLTSSAVPHVYFTLRCLYIGGRKWMETEHREEVHVHARERRREDGLWGLKVLPGLWSFYGEGWVWRRERGEEIFMKEGGEAWGCDCFPTGVGRG